MEAVGTAASILQLAGTATKTSLQVYEFISTIKNAPREIESLNHDIMNFHILVNNLTNALGSREVREIVDMDKQISNAMRDLLVPMAKCQLTCDQVQSKLRLHLQLEESADNGPRNTSSDNGTHGNGQKKGTQIWVRDWLWPFRRKEVFALMTDLDRTRSMFSDAMAGLTLILMLRKSTATTTTTEPTKEIYRKHTFNDDAGSAILDFASIDESLAPTLVEEKGEKSSDPKYTEDLIKAVHLGSATLVDLMLQQHVDVNARDRRDGRTALSYAAELGNVEIAELLLKRGAAVNIRQYSLSKRAVGQGMNDQPWMVSGRMPIHWAAVKRHSAVVELLLQYGANPNARNTPGRLVIQDSCVNGDLKSVRLLLKSGADVNARSYGSGWTALHEAATWNHIEISRILLGSNPLLDVPAVHHPEGCSPLHIATRWGHYEIMEHLLSNGADSNILMVEDITPLHLAAVGGWMNELDLLLDWGAAINVQDARLRETPLHKAARNLELVVIEKLCARGADTEVTNIDGQTYQALLDCARENPGDWYVETRVGSFCRT